MSQRRSLMDRINDIDVEDLQYVENDLCFYELVSLGFLLYGRERTTTEFILQKFIVLSCNPPKGKGTVIPSGKDTATQTSTPSDILQKYALINPNTWRVNIVEALAIIRAKKVLRQLGFVWRELHEHYLPHIPELSIHIHPLLKALYKICERLTIAQAGRLVMSINAIHFREDSQHLRFYDYGNLEVFLLYWMTRRIITIGDQNLKGADMQELISYFKLNDFDSIKEVLIETIKHNSTHFDGELSAVRQSSGQSIGQVQQVDETNEDSGAVMESLELFSSEQQVQYERKHEEFDSSERYTIRHKTAGFVLIINQNEFYQDPNPELKNILPKIPFKKNRAGTDVDRDKLSKLFSSFGYTPLVYNNLTHINMLHTIRETVKKSLLRDSLIICILTHGMEGVVYGCNSVPVSINTIRAILSTDTMKGKPKMLIIQACQKDIAPVDTSVSNNETNVKADDYADMVTAMSSIPGTDALRHTQTGSLFIESLCEITSKWGGRKHMLDILTNVIADVTKKHGKAMLPITSTTLRKEFHLPSLPN